MHLSSLLSVVLLLFSLSVCFKENITLNVTTLVYNPLFCPTFDLFRRLPFPSGITPEDSHWQSHGHLYTTPQSTCCKPISLREYLQLRLAIFFLSYYLRTVYTPSVSYMRKQTIYFGLIHSQKLDKILVRCMIIHLGGLLYFPLTLYLPLIGSDLVRPVTDS